MDVATNQIIRAEATIESLQGTVNRVRNEKYVSKSGICIEQMQKFVAAQNAEQRGNLNAAVQILQAFQNAVQAQLGKLIKPEAIWLLMMDSNYVIQRLKSTK